LTKKPLEQIINKTIYNNFMILSTTPFIERHAVQQYLGLVAGEVVLGANFFRDWMAGITNVLGGRSGAYEASMSEARKKSIAELEDKAKKLGANAVIGVSFHYSTIEFENTSMLMVGCSGTAVVLESNQMQNRN
jgi:uncharacterized protein YbjQ (UPF0145 family)